MKYRALSWKPNSIASRCERHAEKVIEVAASGEIDIALASEVSKRFLEIAKLCRAEAR